MAVQFNELSTPDDVSESRIFVPRGYDLPYYLQIVDAEDCSSNRGDPYDLAGNEVKMEVFDSKYADLDSPLLTFPNADWTRQESDGQDTPVNDIIFKVIEWSELTALDEGRDYWYRISGTDADGVEYGLKRGVFRKGDTV